VRETFVIAFVDLGRRGDVDFEVGLGTHGYDLSEVGKVVGQ
jgi:hypothetical protein